MIVKKCAGCGKEYDLDTWLKAKYAEDSEYGEWRTCSCHNTMLVKYERLCHALDLEMEYQEVTVL